MHGKVAALGLSLCPRGCCGACPFSRLTLPSQKKVDPDLPIAAKPSSRVRKLLEEQMRKERQRAQRRLEEMRNWCSELRCLQDRGRPALIPSRAGL